MDVNLVASFFKMIFALAIVLGVLIGVMYFVKMFMQSSVNSSENQALINVVSSKYLGPKSRIILVEVLDQILVVGISGQQMTTLACIDDPLAKEKIKNSRYNSPGIDFPAGKLARYVSALNFTASRKKDKVGK